jgi:hypothetical protein
MSTDDTLVSIAQALGVTLLIIGVPVAAAVVIRLRQRHRHRRARKAWEAHMAAVPKQLSPSQRDFLHRTAAWRRMQGSHE